MKQKKKLHFVGVGGVGMGSLAEALSIAGHEISGSDNALYDPMKSVLEHANVKFLKGYQAKHVESVSPDGVVIGNVVRKENEEASAWIRSGVPFYSFPEAVRRFVIENRTSVVCAGTHGKTTTTSWVAYLFKEVGLSPSYLIGGVPKDLPHGSALVEGDVFVGEGDEYDSAFFDKGPKFLHYNPDVLILSGIEFDHADIYADLAAVKRSFEKLIALLPGTGLCIARYEDPNVRELIQQSLCPVATFGVDPLSMWQVEEVGESERGIAFDVYYKRKKIVRCETPLFGSYNLANLLSGIIAAANFGIPIEKIAPVVSTFGGVRRRQERLLETPVVLIDDFAHHPTAVNGMLTAARKRFPNKTLWALFEPRSATARTNVHEMEYVEALATADKVAIKSPYRADEVDQANRFSPQKIVGALKTRQVDAHAFSTTDEILAYFLDTYKPGDVVIVMSNGEFDKIQEKLVSALS